MKNKNHRGAFLFNCEKLGLRDWKLVFTYKDLCNEYYPTFIDRVLRCDEVIINALREQETQTNRRGFIA